MLFRSNFFLDSIPSQLYDVASLNTIRLDNNFFTGTLPLLMGQLTDLEDFQVQNNNLSGTIPESIGSMTSLGECFFFSNAGVSRACFCHKVNREKS